MLESKWFSLNFNNCWQNFVNMVDVLRANCWRQLCLPDINHTINCVSNYTINRVSNYTINRVSNYTINPILLILLHPSNVYQRYCDLQWWEVGPEKLWLDDLLQKYLEKKSSWSQISKGNVIKINSMK